LFLYNEFGAFDIHDLRVCVRLGDGKTTMKQSYAMLHSTKQATSLVPRSGKSETGENCTI